MQAATPPTATGTLEREAGVPVVDLTATLEGLLQHAERCRSLSKDLDRQASYLEDLARILSGS